MTMPSELAINGGPKAKTTPYGTAMRYMDNELAYLKEVLEQNTLFYDFGRFVKRACEMMKAYTQMPFVVACASGSAAVHLGLVVAGVGPGDEVILTPNTDSGSIIGILLEGAVPVFCDCDWTLQPTAQTVAASVDVNAGGQNWLGTGVGSLNQDATLAGSLSVNVGGVGAGTGAFDGALVGVNDAGTGAPTGAMLSYQMNATSPITGTVAGVAAMGLVP